MANRTNQSLLSPDRPTRYSGQATKWFRFYSLFVIFVFVASSLPSLIQAAASDLTVSVTDTKATAVAGEQLTYTVRVTNNSAAAITTDIALTLPTQVSFVAESTPSTVAGSTYTWSGVVVNAGASVFRYVTADINTGLAVNTVLTTNLVVTDTGDSSTTSASDVTYIEAPAVQFDPDTWNFGNVEVGTTSAAKAITLKNTGTIPLTINAISAAAPFAATNGNCPTAPTPLASNAECTINVTFSPTVAGPANGSLSVTNSASGSPHTVSLSGVGAQAAISLSTTTLAFGDVQVGSSSNLTFDITNSGSAPLVISALNLPAGAFTRSTNCVTSLAVGASCTVTVTFAPTATGAQNATITINSNVPAATVSLTGTGVQAGVSLTPSTLTFGNQALNTASTAQVVTLTNTGTAPLSFSSLSLTAGAAHYQITNTCTSPLAAGASCTVDVVFQPTVIGAQPGTLSLVSNVAGSPHTVTLSGTGIAGVLTATPSTLAFGNVNVGSTGSEVITLSNTGSDSLTINTIGTLAAPYSVASTTCTLPQTLAVGASCTVTVEFSPTAHGAANATLTVTLAIGAALNISITGTGMQAALAVNKMTVPFGNQIINTTSGVQTVTISNNGNLPLNLTSVSLADGTHFAIQSTTCGASLAGGASCVVSLTFTPTSTGVKNTNLVIVHDAPTPASPVDVALSGTGIEPMISLSPASLDFGEQALNTNSVAQTVTITNTGVGPLSITGSTITSGFSRTTTCGATLAEGASCTISVIFSPTTLGNQTGTLTVNSNAVSGGNTVSLAGVGVQAAIQLNPSSLNFGNVNVGDTSPPQTITVTNNGTNALTISAIAASGDFNQTSDCPVSPASLAVGASCTINVTFQPNTPRTANQQLTITSDAATPQLNVPLTGVGIAPEYASNPTPGSITMTSVFNTANSRTITVQNTGTGTLTVSAPSGTIAAPFSVSPNTSFSVAPGASRDIVVTCTPAAAGPYTQTLTYTSNAANQPTATYNISCTGTAAPTAGFSSNPAPNSTWHIGSPFVGFSGSGNIVVNETGSAALEVGLAGGSLATAITGPNASEFTITAPTSFPLTIADGGQAERITVQCTPTAAGLRTATLTLSTNDPSQPTVTYTLTCQWRTTSAFSVYLPSIKKEQGAQPGQPDLVAKLNVSTLTSKAGEPVGISVTITNQGTAPANDFWVDLYINPSVAPTAPNQQWSDLCTLNPCYGIAWYVTQMIEPGQSIILTSEADSYYADNTIWNGSFAPGTSDLYVYVDSWNPTVATGAIVESNETNNRDEIHGLKVSGSLTASNDPRRADRLPERPVRP